MARRAAPLFLAMAALGCSQSSPDTAAPAVDADATPLDATMAIDVAAPDAEADDAPAPLDALPPLADAPPMELPDASHWCDSQEFIFCDDFDEYDLAQGWDGTDEESATIALDDATYVSAPYSFLVTTSAVGVDGFALGRLQKRVTDLVEQIEFAFDLRPELLDPSGAPLVVATIELSDASGTLIDTVNLVLAGAGARIDDDAPATDGGAGFAASYPFSTPPPIGGWSRVEIDIAFPGDAGLGAGTITVLVGSAPSVDHVAMSPSSQPAFPFLFLGAGAEGPSAPTQVRFDDVTLDYGQ